MRPADRLQMRHLLERVRVVADEVEEQRLIDELIGCHGSTIVSFLNQSGFNLACGDPSYRALLMASGVLLRDGVGMEVCLGLLGQRAGRNTNGTDLIPRLLKAVSRRRILVIGTCSPWLTRAVARMRRDGIEVAAAIDGFQPWEHYLVQVRRVQPEVVLLAMGTPLQERLATALLAAADRPVLVINGGAILDFYAGRFPRAPRPLRRARLEWLFRLALEPRRLAPRYLIGGPVFLARALELRWTRPAREFGWRPSGRSAA